MTALYHDHVRPDGAEGGNLLRRAARPVTHSRGYDTSALAGRGGLLTNPNTRPDRAFTRSGHFGVVEPRLYSLGEPPSRTAGRRSRIVTWALPQTGPRARPLDAGYFRQGLVPATSFRRGWGWHLRKGKAKSVETSMFARIEAAYLDMCGKQAANLLMEVERDNKAAGHDLDADIAEELAALLAKIEARKARAK